MRGIGTLLLGVHLVLGIWALAGFVELFFETTPWPRISNELFPAPVLLMQWSLSLAAAVTFIGGYVAGWARLPVAMAGLYAAMAALCAVQNTVYLTHDLRWAAMGVEYLAYAAILLFLFRRRGPAARGPAAARSAGWS